MSAVTVVAVAEPSTGPQVRPRVRLNVTDTSTPELFSTTVMRLDPDGRLVPVRTPDGGPLQLSASGSSRVGLLYDYEMPLDAPVTYSTVESPAASSTPVTVPDARAWLVHPGVPSLSMPVEFRADSFAVEEWSVQQGVFRPMGRETAVVQTDGVRKAAESAFTVAIETLEDLRWLKALLRDAGTLLLNIPASLGFGIDPCYIAPGSVRNARVSSIGGSELRDVVIPYTVVDRPAGGSQSERTYADLSGFATYPDLAAGYDSYFDLLTGP